MVPFRYKLFIEDLTYLVESGKIPIARIDDAVERILRVKFVAGIFEYPLTDRSLLDTVGCKVDFSFLKIRCIASWPHHKAHTLYFLLGKKDSFMLKLN